jgi:hypothetical protein
VHGCCHTCRCWFAVSTASVGVMPLHGLSGETLFLLSPLHLIQNLFVCADVSRY